MASETDCSNSSASSELEKRRKLQIKLKGKTEKKSKKHKKEKKNKSKKRKHSGKKTTSSNEENLRTHKYDAQYSTELITPIDNNEEKFGPALPPHLQNKTKKVEKSENSLVIGPIIPQEFIECKRLLILETEEEENKIQNSGTFESDDADMQNSYGPLPVTNEREMSEAQIELEQRALELKMAAIQGTSSTISDQNIREEWMLKLPDVGLKSGLAALTNLKRGFHQGKEKPDFSDRSSWTKTPQTENENQLTFAKVSKERLEQQAQALYEEQRDLELEAIAKKHKKKHKRDESLVRMHQKKLRKEEKKKAKELRESGAKPERRPFTRDIDLKLNKIDRNQTKQIVDKAKILNTRFSAGQSKYL